MTAKADRTGTDTRARVNMRARMDGRCGYCRSRIRPLYGTEGNCDCSRWTTRGAKNGHDYWHRYSDPRTN
jgi:hypothetical protein